MTLNTNKIASSALIFCVETDYVNRTIAGLTVGERLLLSLAYGGVNRVAFAGSGPKPESDRADIQIVSVEDLQRDGGRVFVCTSDLIFDRSFIKQPPETLDQYPFQLVDAGDLTNLISSGFQTEKTKQVLTPQGYALCVQSDSDAKLAGKILYKSLIKPIDGFISKNVNRKFSLFITARLINSSLTPNQVTIFSMMVGLLSGVAAYFGEYWWSLLIAGLLFQGQSMLDGCDGEIARLKYQFSLKGQWLDTVSDDLTNYAFFAGLGLGQAKVHGWEWMTIATFAIFAVQVYASLIMYQRIYKMKTGDLLAIPNMVTGGTPKGAAGKIVKILHTMTKKDFFVFITSILAAAQFPLVSFFLIAGGSLVMAPSLTLNEIRIRKAIKNGTLNHP